MAAPAAAKSQWVTMVSPSGETRDVRADSVDAALTPDESGSAWHVETPDEKAFRAYQDNEGKTLTEQGKALAETYAGDLSFGASDLVTVNDANRQQRQFRDRNFPGTKLVGHLLAAATPIAGELAGANVAAKGARVIGAPMTAVSRGASKVGGLAERMVAGNAPGLARRALSKTGGGVTAGVLEGSAIGAQQAITESAVQDKQLTAELLMAHIGEGATIVGSIGGGMAGAGALLGLAQKGSKAALRHVPGVGEVSAGAERAGNVAALKALGFQKGAVKQLVRKHGAGAVDEFGAEAQSILGTREPGALRRGVEYDFEQGAGMVAETKERLNQRLGEIYSELAPAGERANVGTIVGRVDSDVLAPLRSSIAQSDRDLVRTIEHEMLPLRERIAKVERLRAAADAVPVVESRLAEMGNLIATRDYEGFASAAKQFRRDTLGSEGLADSFRGAGMQSSASRLRDLNRALREAATGGGAGIYQKMEVVRGAYKLLDEDVAAHVARRGTPQASYDELHKLAQSLDKNVKNFSATRDPKELAYRKYWGIVKDEIAAQAERTGRGTELKELNQQLKRVIELDRVAQDSASFAGNRRVGLTDTIAGGIGAGAGSILGGGLGAAIAGMGAATANRFIRSEAGDFMLAAGANKYQSWRNAVRASDAASAALSRDISSAIKTAPPKQRVLGLAARIGQQFEAEQTATQARQAEQELLIRAVQAQAEEASQAAPELTSAFLSTGARAQAYLSENLPKPIELGDLHDQAEAPSIPESEKAEWLRKLGVVRDPKSVLRDLKKGTLTSGQVDTLKSVYPALYGQIQRDALQKITEASLRGEIPPYEQRAQFSTLTGIPLDASFKPEMIRAFQARYAAPPGMGEPKPPKPRRRASAGAGVASRRKSPLDTEES